jgi:hypothetical protein
MVCTFCIAQKVPKTLGEKIALLKAGSRTHFFSNPPA